MVSSEVGLVVNERGDYGIGFMSMLRFRGQQGSFCNAGR